MAVLLVAFVLSPEFGNIGGQSGRHLRDGAAFVSLLNRTPDGRAPDGFFERRPIPADLSSVLL